MVVIQIVLSHKSTSLDFVTRLTITAAEPTNQLSYHNVIAHLHTSPNPSINCNLSNTLQYIYSIYLVMRGKKRKAPILKPRKRMRNQIRFMEANEAYRRENPYVMRECHQELYARNLKEREARFAHLPPLPPKLPLPEYSAHSGLVGTSDEELDFYSACEEGDLDGVTTFIQNHQPTQPTRQYGLHLAAFANQPSIARHLLANGTIIHTDIFQRSLRKPDGTSDHTDLSYETRLSDIRPLLQTFLDAGWHPDQDMSNKLRIGPAFILDWSSSLGNISLIEFLLANGADPCLGRAKDFIFLRNPVDRASGTVFDQAVKTLDIALAQLLIAYGAIPSISLHLLNLVQDMTDIVNDPPSEHGYKKPFSAREPMAKYLLSLAGVGINDIKSINWPHDALRMFYPGKMEEITPLSYACAGQDWDFVVWLLENGADPNLLDGKALKQQWWKKPRIGPNDPNTVAELIEQVKKRGGSE